MDNDKITSSGTNTLSALRNNENWHNGAAGEFNLSPAFNWNYSCVPTWANSWPNMYHACGNASGVHWLSSTYHYFGTGGVNYPKKSETFLK